MSDFFIVTSRKFYRHSSLTEAEQARNKFLREEPDRKYRVLRCKSHLHGAHHFSTMVQLMKDIRDQGLYEGTYDRLNELLAKIEEREEQAKAAREVANTTAEDSA